MSDLVTGEAVPLELRLAKLPSRALGIILDLTLLVAVAIPLGIAISAVVSTVDAALGAAITLVGFVALFVGVPVLVETLTRGRSLGKLALGLRVVRDDGGPVRFRHALTRALAGVFVDFLLTSGAGAVICSLLNERGKRVGDILAGTVVVRERVPITAAPLPAIPPPLAAWATTLELSRLPADVALAARGYLTRYHELSPAVRDRMGGQLATEISKTVTPPAPPGTPAWAYLTAVLGERNRRESQRFTEAARAGTDTVPAPPPAGPTSLPAGSPEAQNAAPGGFTPPA
ncbi:MAG TPA: RDD family protein [Jiangellaceae bacterium]|nr:RDD family protein [Jiangellaceae bacterium]